MWIPKDLKRSMFLLFMSEPHQAHPATAVCAALHEVVVPAKKNKKHDNGATKS